MTATTEAVSCASGNNNSNNVLCCRRTHRTMRKRATPFFVSRILSGVSSGTCISLWGIVRLAIVAISVISIPNVVLGFQQQSLQFSPQRKTHRTTYNCRQVVTDPNNLLRQTQHETRRRHKGTGGVAVDRTVLEQLYILSVAAEAEQLPSASSSDTMKRKNAKLRKKPSSSRTTSSTRSGQPKRRAASASSSALQATAIANVGSEHDIRKDIRSQAVIAIKSVSAYSSSRTTTSLPRFKGLTSSPNRRNKREKSLTTISPIARNPTLRRQAEEKQNKDSGCLIGLAKSTDSSSNVSLLPHDADNVSLPMDSVGEDEISTKNVSASLKLKKKLRRSSTMPGYLGRGETLRQERYGSGIRSAEQRLGRKIIESKKSLQRRKKINGENMYKNSASVPDSLFHFSKQVHKIDRITPTEEKSLGKKIQEAIKLQNTYNRLVTTLQREPTEKEWCAASGKINVEAIAQTIEEGLEAKNQLVLSNLRMVQGVVNVYIRNGLQGNYNAGDLMQEGIMGLIRAAEKFDPTRGFRFSTYAMYWIRAAIKRDQLLQSRTIVIPQELHEGHKKLEKIRKEWMDAYNRPPTETELEEATGMSPVQIHRCEDAVSQREFSFDQRSVNFFRNPENAQDDSENMYDIIESKTDEEANWVQHQLFREDLINILHHHLDEKEVKLLMLRYGLIEHHGPLKTSGLRTVAEVGKVVGLKPDTVHRIVKRSLRKMQAVIGEEWQKYESEFASSFN